MAKGSHLLFSYLICFFSLNAFSETLITGTQTLELGKGRIVEWQFQENSKKKGPVFLLLPGVNRNILMSEDVVSELRKRDIRFALFNFSTQPLSVRHLPENIKADFESREYSLRDLTEEVIAVSKVLSKSLSISLGEIFPVSLSYSGAVSSNLKARNGVIDFAPMTSSRAVNPELESTRDLLRQGELFNPIWGPGITRSSLDLSYRNYWQKQVDKMILQFELPIRKRQQFIEGYTSISRATEGFVWPKCDLNTPRLFVLAEKDAKSLLKDQLQTLLRLQEQACSIKVIVVHGSGHVLPADRPDVYADILLKVYSNKVSGLSQFNEIDLQGQWQSWDESQFKEKVEEWLRRQ